MKPTLYEEIKPRRINQPWGRYDPVYKQFFDGSYHNGTDHAPGERKEVRAPFPGVVVRCGTKQNGQWQPNGGGVYVSVLSRYAYDFPAWSEVCSDGLVVNFRAGTYYILADYLHMESVKVSLGQEVEIGDLLGIADNTGFSTGIHTHIQGRREHKNFSEPPEGVSRYRILGEDFWLGDVDKNGANNSFPMERFYVGYAADYKISFLTKKIQELQLKVIEILKAKIASLKGR